MKESKEIGYTGYKLNKKSRQQLAAIFPPKFSDFIGHHVTYKFGVSEDQKPGPVKEAYVVGYAEEDGLEALVIEINGKTTRPDGKLLHITWSLDRSKGKKPVHSNNLLANGFTEVEKTPISVKPTFFSRSKK